MFTFLFTEWFAVQYAKQQWPECAAIPDGMVADLAALDSKKLSYIAPQNDFFYFTDLSYDGQSISDQFLTGQKALYDGDYALLGKMLGEIYQMAEMPAEDDPKVDFTNLSEMVQGFLSKLGVDFNFLDLLVCIYEADQSALMLYEDIEMAEEAWKDKDIMEGVFVAVLTLAFVQSLQQQVEPACANVFGNHDFSTINQFAKELSQPMHYVHANMQVQAALAGEHYEAEDWFNYGSALAATLSQMGFAEPRFEAVY